MIQAAHPVNQTTFQLLPASQGEGRGLLSLVITLVPHSPACTEKPESGFKISHSSTKGSIFLAQRAAFLCCFPLPAFLLTWRSDRGQLFNHMSHCPAMMFVGSYFRAKKELHDSCKHQTWCSARKPTREVFLSLRWYI